MAKQERDLPDFLYGDPKIYTTFDPTSFNRRRSFYEPDVHKHRDVPVYTFSSRNIRTALRRVICPDSTYRRLGRLYLNAVINLTSEGTIPCAKPTRNNPHPKPSTSDKALLDQKKIQKIRECIQQVLSGDFSQIKPVRRAGYLPQQQKSAPHP